MIDKKFDPASAVQDTQNFGEFGGVNPSITDSSTYTFLKAESMEGTFGGETEGCYLYSRHWNPSNKYLANALAKMEGAEAAQVVGSGMAAISNVTMQICAAGDHIISSQTIYGGTYSLFHFYLPKFNINTTLLDITDLDAVEKAITPNTKMIFCEVMSNPLLEIADLKALSELAHKNGIKLVVDNTFTPMVFSPLKFGVDVVIHSLTKFINGASDTVGGAICSTEEFINSLMDLNTGSTMLLGPTMDGVRSASILKNLRTLHIRMMQHSKNAMYLANRLEEDGVRVRYAGLDSHPSYDLMKKQMNADYGFGGMILIDCKSKENAYKLMDSMQEDNVGYLAVSLGFYKTLFSAPGSSTSSEIPEEEQGDMGLSPGLIRMSVGLDMDIERTYETIKIRLAEVGLI
ncbi:aminotransferase class I/II-fold pyridoxal phosphate-dependent enzyme [bacterium SCSIO 12643]|nr:aminotransferase class I/II-fold pyridoxal phosphate-dependent enzyme [bacterium SCSIO 12643]